MAWLQHGRRAQHRKQESLPHKPCCGTDNPRRGTSVPQALMAVLVVLLLCPARTSAGPFGIPADLEFKYFGVDEALFDTANDACVANNGTLTSVASVDENLEINRIRATTSSVSEFWLGVQYQECDFIFLDGTPYLPDVHEQFLLNKVHPITCVFDKEVENIAMVRSGRWQRFANSTGTEFPGLCKRNLVCDPQTEFLDMTTHTCKPARACGPREFMAAPPTWSSDTVCEPLTHCVPHGEYEALSPTVTSDRVCKGLRLCGKDEYVTSGPTLSTDRICAQVTPCSPTQFQTALPTATSDRRCNTTITCQPGLYEVVAPTATTDRACAALNASCGVLEYLDRSTNSCRPLEECQLGVSFEVVPPLPSRNRVCTRVRTCGSTQYETNAPTLLTDRTCANHSVCANGSFELNAATPTSDVVCPPHTVCRQNADEAAPPTQTSDRICREFDEVPQFLGTDGALLLNPKDVSVFIEGGTLNLGPFHALAASVMAGGEDGLALGDTVARYRLATVAHGLPLTLVTWVKVIDNVNAYIASAGAKAAAFISPDAFGLRETERSRLNGVVEYDLVYQKHDPALHANSTVGFTINIDAINAVSTVCHPQPNVFFQEPCRSNVSTIFVLTELTNCVGSINRVTGRDDEEINIDWPVPYTVDLHPLMWQTVQVNTLLSQGGGNPQQRIFAKGIYEVVYGIEPVALARPPHCRIRITVGAGQVIEVQKPIANVHSRSPLVVSASFLDNTGDEASLTPVHTARSRVATTGLQLVASQARRFHVNVPTGTQAVLRFQLGYCTEAATSVDRARSALQITLEGLDAGVRQPTIYIDTATGTSGSGRCFHLFAESEPITSSLSFERITLLLIPLEFATVHHPFTSSIGVIDIAEATQGTVQQRLALGRFLGDEVTVTIPQRWSQITATLTAPHDDGDHDDYADGQYITDGSDPFVTLDDTEPPLFATCPQDITVVVARNETNTTVSWEEPQAIDNIAIARVEANAKPDSVFTVLDSPHHVLYTAFDTSGLSTTCVFHVYVEAETHVANTTLTIDQNDIVSAPGWALQHGAFVESAEMDIIDTTRISKSSLTLDADNGSFADANVFVFRLAPPVGRRFSLSYRDLDTQARLVFDLLLHHNVSDAGDASMKSTAVFPAAFTNVTLEDPRGSDGSPLTQKFHWFASSSDTALVAATGCDLEAEAGTPLRLRFGGEGVLPPVNFSFAAIHICLHWPRKPSVADPMTCANNTTNSSAPVFNSASAVSSSPRSPMQMHSNTSSNSSNSSTSTSSSTSSNSTSSNTATMSSTLAPATTPTNMPISSVQGATGQPLSFVLHPSSWLGIEYYFVDRVGADISRSHRRRLFGLASDNPPSFGNSCPGDIVVDATPGTAKARVRWEEPEAQDDYGLTSVTASHTPDTVLPLVLREDPMSGGYKEGSHTIVYTAMDTHGLISTCSFAVTVRDIEPPQIRCPRNQVYILDTRASEVRVDASQLLPTSVSDNAEVVCPSNDSTFVPASSPSRPCLSVSTPPTMFGVGENLVSIAAHDAVGNEAMCSFVVSVRDEEPPQFANCPKKALTVVATNATAAVSWDRILVSDNDKVVSINSSHANGGRLPVGKHIIVVEAWDPSRNHAECRFNVTIASLSSDSDGTGGSGAAPLASVTAGIIGMVALVIFLFVSLLVYWRTSAQAHDFSNILDEMEEHGLDIGSGEGPQKPRELKRSTVFALEQLGKGNFGVVSKGCVREHFRPEYLVAIKQLHTTADDAAKEELLRECAIMAQFHHPHVVSLVGVITVGEPLMAVIEYSEHGSLKRYLGRKVISLAERHCMAADCAEGLAYLTSRGYVHRDVAARNVLVNSLLHCKISDFGLSREKGTHEDAYYQGSREVALPVRWCAIEALEHGKFSSASDCWSYGILLYEIWTNGQVPYAMWNNQRVWTAVKSGYRLPCPDGCPDNVHKIMRACWDSDQSKRPAFTDMAVTFHQLYESASANDPQRRKTLTLSNDCDDRRVGTPGTKRKGRSKYSRRDSRRSTSSLKGTHHTLTRSVSGRLYNAYHPHGKRDWSASTSPQCNSSISKEYDNDRRGTTSDSSYPESGNGGSSVSGRQEYCHPSFPSFRLYGMGSVGVISSRGGGEGGEYGALAGANEARNSISGDVARYSPSLPVLSESEDEAEDGKYRPVTSAYAGGTSGGDGPYSADYGFVDTRDGGSSYNVNTDTDDDGNDDGNDDDMNAPSRTMLLKSGNRLRSYASALVDHMDSRRPSLAHGAALCSDLGEGDDRCGTSYKSPRGSEYWSRKRGSSDSHAKDMQPLMAQNLDRRRVASCGKQRLHEIRNTTHGAGGGQDQGRPPPPPSSATTAADEETVDTNQSDTDMLRVVRIDKYTSEV